jgi:hypothetical protein
MPELKEVLQARAVDGGHAIELDLMFTDGSQETIKCVLESAPRLAHAIHATAVIAERLQKAQPTEEVSTEIPYVVTGTQTGAGVDGKTVVIRFLTKSFPILISMSPDLARRTNERLEAELAKLGKQQPPRLS